MSYQWLGNANVTQFADTVSSQITPTRTIFTIHAGPMKFNVTFFSPIEINDYVRQSIPFTYLFVDSFTADDAKPHTVQLYSDISAEWVSASFSTVVNPDQKASVDMSYLMFKAPGMTSDNDDSAEDATAIYAMRRQSNLTWQIGLDKDLRTSFSQQGHLANIRDDNVRPIDQAGEWPVLSLAADLGSITPDNQPEPVVWALGLVRETVVSYETESGFQNRTGYYRSAYRNDDDAVSDFLQGFEDARSRGQTFDKNIIEAASSISPEYAEILSLVTRQVFASMDITIPSGNGEQFRASDVMIFMKDISQSKRVNPVEVIYSALPALLYFNSSFVHDLLLPLFEFQSSSSALYASSDLGNEYPIFSNNVNADPKQAIEQCGNMLIMVYAHATKSGDGSLINNPKYHSLLDKWANYLVQNSLHPDNCTSADGFGYPGMSNLALKGILGIYSMGKIDKVVRPSNTTFKEKATELINEWKQLAVTGTHIQAEYGKPDTWGLIYNLFSAVWLQTGLIDNDTLNREAQFYLNNTPTGNQSYSLDTVRGSGLAYPHLALLTAATMPSVRDIIIKSTHNQAFNVSTGNAVNRSLGSAAQGAAFAILAMNEKPNLPITLPRTDKKTRVGAIVGGVIGGVALFLIVVGAIFCWRRSRVRQPKVVIDPHYEEEQARPRPFETQRGPTANDSTSRLQKQSSNANLLSSDPREPRSVSRHSARSDEDPPLAGAAPSQSSQKDREASLPNQSAQNQSESVESAPPNAPSAVRSERAQTWRAEVGELRREMEAIRNMAEPPPSYE